MEAKKKDTINKIVGAVSAILAVFCMCLLIYVTVSMAVKKHVSVFGYSISIVVTDSMTPEINVGDMVVSKKTDTEDIKVGDDIVFVSADPELKGRTVVHRVVAVNGDGSFTTCGIKTGATVDKYPATEIIGKVTSVSPSGGQLVLKMVENKSWIFVLIAVLAIAIAITECVHIAKLTKKAKSEDEAVKELREEMKKEIMLENGMIPDINQTETENEAEMSCSTVDETDSAAEETDVTDDLNAKENNTDKTENE